MRSFFTPFDEHYSAIVEPIKESSFRSCRLFSAFPQSPPHHNTTYEREAFLTVQLHLVSVDGIGKTAVLLYDSRSIPTTLSRLNDGISIRILLLSAFVPDLISPLQVYQQRVVGLIGGGRCSHRRRLLLPRRLTFCGRWPIYHQYRCWRIILILDFVVILIIVTGTQWQWW